MTQELPGPDERIMPPAEPRTSRRTVWALAATSLLLCIAVAVWFGYRERHPTPVPVVLETVKAEVADIEQVVNATGNVAMQSYVDVGAKVSGQISDVSVGIGESVKEGRLLVTISPAVAAGRVENNRAQLARLKAELAGQNAQLDFAQLQFQRQTN